LPEKRQLYKGKHPAIAKARQYRPEEVHSEIQKKQANGGPAFGRHQKGQEARQWPMRTAKAGRSPLIAKGKAKPGVVLLTSMTGPDDRGKRVRTQKSVSWEGALGEKIAVVCSAVPWSSNITNISKAVCGIIGGDTSIGLNICGIDRLNEDISRNTKEGKRGDS